MSESSPAVETNVIKKVGVVGVGAMGGAVARRLADVGYDVCVYDVNSARAHEIAGSRMRVAGSAADAASNADLVLTCLPDGDRLRSAVSGRTGVASGARPGAVVMDMSTVFPEDSEEISRLLAEQAIEFVDCPVARTTDHALRGELVALLGGDRSTISKVRTVVDQLATDVIECGPVGSGAKMKLINNLCAMSILFVTLEAIAAGERAGLSRDVLMGALSATGVRNGHLLGTVPSRVFADHYAPGFRASLAQKDLRQAIEYLSRLGADTPVSSGSLAAVTALNGTRARDLDVSSYYLKLTGRLSE